MQIGEVAERVGLSLRTVRYYEEVGLVTPVERSTGGFRIYDQDAVARLMLVRDLKPLGFSLEEIRDIADMVASQGNLDAKTLARYVERAREEHTKARRSLKAAERIIDTLEQLTTSGSSNSKRRRQERQESTT